MTPEKEDNQCPMGAENRARIVNIEKILDRVQNRLPLWATGAFAACGIVIGFLIDLKIPS